MSTDKDQPIRIQAFDTSAIGAARVETGNPTAYRLGRKPSGELVLQGCYQWWQGMGAAGHEWREIPVVEMPA